MQEDIILPALVRNERGYSTTCNSTKWQTVFHYLH